MISTIESWSYLCHRVLSGRLGKRNYMYRPNTSLTVIRQHSRRH